MGYNSGRWRRHTEMCVISARPWKKGACISVKKACLLLLCAALLLGLCACGGTKEYTAETYAFDTVISLTAYCGSREEFETLRSAVFGRMQELHKKFDIYNEYEGLNNLCTVNRLAGQAVPVDGDILELLASALQAEKLTGGRVNIAMGRLFGLWKEARDTGVLPAEDAIREAMLHGDPADVLLDRENGTVTLRDPEMALDVGAVAKGWAAGQAVRAADELERTNFVLSAGGNVVVRGLVKDRLWKVGIRDPLSQDGTGHAAVVEATDMALVTSGGYERNLTVDGRTYCHIIDPQTGWPADKVLSATAVCEDSGRADALSTALFLMDAEEGIAFARENGFRAIVIDREGTVWDSEDR